MFIHDEARRYGGRNGLVLMFSGSWGPLLHLYLTPGLLVWHCSILDILLNRTLSFLLYMLRLGIGRSVIWECFAAEATCDIQALVFAI